MKQKEIVWILCFCLLFLLIGCKENKEGRCFPYRPLQVGDIVFRRGTGLSSRAIITIDNRGLYSHVGVVVNDNGSWKVVHAVPGESDFPGQPDKVKMEPVNVFFASDRAIAGAVMRINMEFSVKSIAAKQAMMLYQRNTVFDHDYDLEDSTKMYCSELVEFVFRKAGVDLVNGKYSKINMPGFSGFYLLPGDIWKSRHLELIDRF